MARIVQAFVEEFRVSLLLWAARSQYMSPIKLVWDMLGEQIVHGPPAITLGALWTSIQTA